MPNNQHMQVYNTTEKPRYTYHSDVANVGIVLITLR